jgi:hypothetical protein
MQFHRSHKYLAIMAHFARIMPFLGDICVIALPERRPYVRGVLAQAILATHNRNF